MFCERKGSGPVSLRILFVFEMGVNIFLKRNLD